MFWARVELAVFITGAVPHAVVIVLLLTSLLKVLECMYLTAEYQDPNTALHRTVDVKSDTGKACRRGCMWEQEAIGLTLADNHNLSSPHLNLLHRDGDRITKNELRKANNLETG